jgi:hypothetical protein
MGTIFSNFYNPEPMPENLLKGLIDVIHDDFNGFERMYIFGSYSFAINERRYQVWFGYHSITGEKIILMQEHQEDDSCDNNHDIFGVEVEKVKEMLQNKF